jgi:hypothetical protein
MTLKEQMDQEYSRGLEDGIKAFIIDKLEDNVSTEIITEKLVKLFSLTREQATAFINQFS